MNILLLVLDDARHDIVRAMPWLRFQRATVFDRFNVTTPRCGPARASLMSGQYARRHGIYTNTDAPDAVAAGTYDHGQLMAPWLQAAGVETCLVGYYGPGGIVADGWSFMRSRSFGGGQEHWEFDVYDETGGMTTVNQWHHEYEAEKLIEFIDSADGPWFAQWSTSSPHINHANPPGFMFDQNGTVPPPFPPQEGTGWPSWIADSPRLWANSGAGVKTIPAAHLGQAREAADVDRHLRRVWEHLETIGVTHETTLIVCSDSGIHLGEQRIAGAAAKNTLYQAALRGPLHVAGPGWHKMTVNTPTSIQDVTATVLETFDAQATIPQDGVSLRATVNAGSRDPILIERKANPHDAEGVVWGDWKLIRNLGVSAADEWEMYNVTNDPFEVTNLAYDPGYLGVRTILNAGLDQLLSNLQEVSP